MLSIYSPIKHEERTLGSWERRLKVLKYLFSKKGTHFPPIEIETIKRDLFITVSISFFLCRAYAELCIIPSAVHHQISTFPHSLKATWCQGTLDGVLPRKNLCFAFTPFKFIITNLLARQLNSSSLSVLTQNQVFNLNL